MLVVRHCLRGSHVACISKSQRTEGIGKVRAEAQCPSFECEAWLAGGGFQKGQCASFVNDFSIRIRASVRVSGAFLEGRKERLDLFLLHPFVNELSSHRRF